MKDKIKVGQILECKETGAEFVVIGATKAHIHYRAGIGKGAVRSEFVHELFNVRSPKNLSTYGEKKCVAGSLPGRREIDAITAYERVASL